MKPDMREAAHSVGLGEAFDFICNREGSDTPAGRLATNVLGTLALYLLETGFAVEPKPPATSP